jgi:hypothetical protein
MRIALSSHAFEPAADRLHGRCRGAAVSLVIPTLTKPALAIEPRCFH